MPKKKIRRDIAHEVEALEAPVGGNQGQSPAVKALLSEEFPSLPDAKATEIALALQQLVRGQASILENLSTQSQELERLRARMAEYDETAARWKADQAAFVESVSNQADKLRVTGDAKDRLIAKAAQDFQTRIAVERAKIASSRIAFEQQIAAMPKVIVRHSGVVVTLNENGGSVQKLEPLTIRIKHMTWVLPPNQDVEVPYIVGERLREMAISDQETDERKAALSASTGVKRDMEVFAAWRKIDAKYSTSTDGVPIAS